MAVGLRNPEIIPDDVILAFGDQANAPLVLSSAGVALNTALTGVLIGTPVTPVALAADSLIIANKIASGDILIAVNKGGTSYMAFMADASTGDTLLGAPTGQSVDVYIAGTKWLDIAANAIVWEGAASTSNASLLVSNTSNAAAASHAIIEAAVGGTTSLGDPQVRFTIPSGTSWVMGPDNSTSDLFCLNTGTTIGPASNTLLTVHAAANMIEGDTLFQFARAPGTFTIASGATAVINQIVNYQNTLNYTGATTVTSLLEWVALRVPTLAGDTATLTVNKATNLSVAAPGTGANVSITNASAIRILDSALPSVNQHGIFIEAMASGATLNQQLTFANGSIEPTSAVADTVGLFGIDVGAATVLGLVCETAVAADVDETKFSNKIQVRINGASYFIMLTTT